MNLNFAIDTKDIQPKNVRTDSNPNNQNKIRRAWVLAMGEQGAELIRKRIPIAEARHAYYQSIDRTVNDKWIELMRKHYNESVSAGAKFVLDRIGGERLEDDFCVNADEQLISAALLVSEEVIEELAKTFK
ncbi:RNA polymerase binding protein [Salmonella phage vB_SenM-AKM_NP4]|uniref:RNA polymerase binding protein n=1 Tax=Salmonella phage S16 TaxID=1087482 RepID=M1EAF3_BPS16|nr:RNA polymerase binding [Salmonella phage vB_SenM-S16]AEO97035.1 RNA polymerase binding protein [Salmonella phage vB_SenM-S16]WDR21715.1 RNA polymerase binding protein [Salmonella phage vB_SenM_UTK0003]WLI71674.1 RNA polymerase binding protein [Salmonella phage vB_SenM-AKM_NP4]